MPEQGGEQEAGGNRFVLFEAGVGVVECALEELACFRLGQQFVERRKDFQTMVDCIV
jgi:hypothetical protein